MVSMRSCLAANRIIGTFFAQEKERSFENK